MGKDFSVKDIFNTKSDEQLDIDAIILANLKTPGENKQEEVILKEPTPEYIPEPEAEPKTEQEKEPVIIQKSDFESIDNKFNTLKKSFSEKSLNIKNALIKHVQDNKAKKEIQQETVKVPITKKQKIFNIAMIVAAALVFVLFGVFLLEQYSYAYLSHDDYGYATLSYIYWEEGMWGQDFTFEQLVHYLTEHYNRWGGRVLSFGQSILLLKQGMDVTRGFHALTLCATFIMAFLFAQNGKKTKLLPLSALFAVALFGFIGKEASISGFYWYIAAILYVVPILYIFIGLWLMYIMLLETRKGVFFTISKILMIPFATIIMFFAGFSMEQTGIFAVVSAGALLCYASFKRTNPFILIYGVPPFISSLIGCHIMLMAQGNVRRKNGLSDFYNLPFSKQILTSGETIVKTFFSHQNILMVVLLTAVTVGAIYFVLKKHKNIFIYALSAVTFLFSIFSLGVACCDFTSPLVSVILWINLILCATMISIWLFMSKTKQDAFIWVLFLGSLASQAACLISPVYHYRCLLMFLITLILVAVRMFNQVLTFSEETKNKKHLLKVLVCLLTMVIIGSVSAGQIYVGFKENNRVQDYNDRLLRVTGIMYDEEGITTKKLSLMRLKNEEYTGSTQPYGRDLIKDWMKIYYKLPTSLTYEDFVYNDYDEELLEELEAQLVILENKYLHN